MEVNMKKIVLFLTLIVLDGAFVFAGGGKETATAIRWSFWGGEARIKNTQLAIDIFTQNTGIIVAAEPAPGTTEHFNKYLTQVAGGGAADIVQLGGDFTNLGVKDNFKTAPGIERLLLDMSPYIKSGIINSSVIDPGAIIEGTRDGKVYAIMLAGNMPGILYNKSLLQRVGAPLPKVSMTWAEFETWLGQVQAKLPANTYAITDFGATTTGSMFFGYWAGQNGTPQWDGTKTYLTAAEVQKYFDMWNRWRTAGYCPPAAVSAGFAETNESNASIVAGRTAAVAAWSNMLVNYQTAMRDELDLIEYPNAVASKGLWVQPSQMMGISAKSKNPEAAAKFLNYRITDPGVWKIMGADPGTPVTAAARTAASSSPEAVKISNYLSVAGQHSGPRNPNIPSDSEWNSGFFLIYQNVAYGRLTTAAAAQQVMDLIARLTR